MTGPVRGIIEGFYDRLWTWGERDRVAAFAAGHGFNAYAYAPKDDRFANGRWREPYPAGHRRALAAFGERCHELGLAWWIGLRPVGIDYARGADAEALVAKLRDQLDLGADRLVLLADDIPSELDAPGATRFATLADAHVWLVELVLASLALEPDRLVFVPTDYHGAGSPYLERIGDGLPTGVDVCWTGPEICSPTITTAEADAVAGVIGRPPLVWDNYPVNDAGMRGELHLGPIRGRDAHLPGRTRGILVNPALEPEATLIPIATWAEYLVDAFDYDPDSAWRRALAEVAGASAAEVAVIAAALDRSVIEQGWERPPDRVFRRAVANLEAMENRRLAADLTPHVAAADRVRSERRRG